MSSGTLPDKVVLATSNEGKAREFKAIFEGFGTELLLQDRFGIRAPEEDGAGFVENALIKARHASGIAGLPALADDSGICVDALNGQPGIMSSRFSGEEGPDRDRANNDKLLEMLNSVMDIRARAAHYVCALALVRGRDDPDPLLAVARWEGSIAFTPAGEGGFGYDPVFYLPDRGLSAAQLPSQLKNLLSHRARAIFRLKARLSEYYKNE